MNNGKGCCESAKLLYYCKAGTLVEVTCSTSEPCGWDTSASYYSCGGSPGGADPSGTYPEQCP